MPQYDRGPVDAGQLINGINLVFTRSASQQAALDQLLAEQQDPASPNYHNWLTPEQFADRFGLSANDVAKVTDWLRSQGLSVAYEARSRTYVTSSGTAAQVQAAFHTELHHYQVDGELHFANSSDPSIPAALQPVVQVIQGLDDFRPKAPVHQFNPNYTSGSAHYLVPGDIAAIYDINPLYQQGITGSGQSIAVIGQSNINLSDIAAFRSSIGLSNNPPQMVLVKGSADPGLVKGDQGESTLDLEYAGGIAQNAIILFVYSSSVVTSEEYAIDQNEAPVMTLSYGACEPAISSSPSSATAYRSFAQQANAQGITWMASTGDTGAAECDNGVQKATHGLAIEIPSSIPEVTAVGGSEFNEGTGTYWSTTNNSTTKASALGYIPEIAWNDTQLSLANGGGLAATGGGASIFFPKPAWQAGNGVPNDGARDVPDLSFSASDYHDPYYVYLNGAATYNTGGTSVSTPIFAGVVSLLNQYLVQNHVQSQPGLGNINPTLYSLAATPTNNVFHDITSGNNIVPCTYGTPNCGSTTMGYSAGPGYDLATGWGSADINNLFTHWPGLPGQGTGATATTTAVSANPASILISGTTVVTATVTAASGSVAPNGSVSFNVGTSNLGTATLTGSGAVATASLKVYGSQLAAGANIITVSYGGSTNFKYSSGSATVTVTVSSTASAVIPSVVPNPVYQQAVTGCPFAFTVILTEIAGVPTTLTDFTFGGNDYATSIPAFFGTANIPAHGTLSAALCATIQTVPSTLTLGFSGKDASGQTWAQQIVVPFYPAQISASMALLSLPGTEVENPKGDPRCNSGYPFFQELNLEEQNGYEVYLNKFLAGGNDLSSEIATWFGTLRLAPLGALQAGICWKLGGTPPVTLSYEIDGVDTGGNTITTTASVVFNNPPATSGGTLAASASAITFKVANGGSAATSVTVNIAAGQAWSASLFPNNQKTSWLVVYPQSGTGQGTVNLAASGAGLAPGAYTATLVIQSVNTIPQFVNVPITFVIGASSNINITNLGNGASFQQAFAPGMILTAFGNNLSNPPNTNLTSSTAPLPFTLGGVSASVNGVPAPLYGVYYYSATGYNSQINLQIPYETPAGTAILAINNNGQVATYSFNVSPANPGIFVAYPTGLIVPIESVAPGGEVLFFITGEGDVSPFVTTGSTPTGVALTQPPVPRLPLTLTVGGVNITPQFVGIPNWSVGVTQINFQVPGNMPGGTQPVVVTVGGNASATAYLNVQNGAADVLFSFIPPSVNQASDGTYHYTAELSEVGGIGVNFTKLVVFGNDYTSQIANWFGSTRLPANTSLSGGFVASCSCSPPWDGTWQITGTDDNGHTNTWSGVVHFLPASSSPNASPAPRPLALRNDTASPDASRGPIQLYPAWQAAISSSAGSPSRLFDLLLNSGAVPPSHVEGAQNAKDVDRRDR
jgi:uncharacterized protein (TIGR03437 family)